MSGIHLSLRSPVCRFYYLGRECGVKSCSFFDKNAHWAVQPPGPNVRACGLWRVPTLGLLALAACPTGCSRARPPPRTVLHQAGRLYLGWQPLIFHPVPCLLNSGVWPSLLCVWVAHISTWYSDPGFNRIYRIFLACLDISMWQSPQVRRYRTCVRQVLHLAS